MLKLLVTIMAVIAAASAATIPSQFSTVRHFQELEPDGSYEYAYETDNGIYVQEEGKVRKINKDGVDLFVQGSFLYTSPEGQEINLKYTADENGFHPEGNHLPTPPPIPPLILKALAWIAANPSKEY
ncbi:larval cuticle protein LCP-17 [Leptinotarsa decemlineata]|uniref:larval cuticle protein LCP-17 n=1 Tax=Leptinotarsa decemlineata TaxID=7539 RepID=UPI000C255955|nr:larval cuticle protein LCP-17-like [Leptinotarsa decemlineata]